MSVLTHFIVLQCVAWLWVGPAVFDTLFDSLCDASRQPPTSDALGDRIMNASTSSDVVAEPHGGDGPQGQTRASSVEQMQVQVSLAAKGVLRFSVRGASSADMLRALLCAGSATNGGDSAHPGRQNVSGGGDCNGGSLNLRFLSDVLNCEALPKLWPDGRILCVVVKPELQQNETEEAIASVTTLKSPWRRRRLSWPLQSALDSWWSSFVGGAPMPLEGGTTALPLLLIRKSFARPRNEYVSCKTHAAPWTWSTAQSRLSGWDIIAPAGRGASLWLAMVMAGGRAVGYREMECLSLSAGLPSFPRDFPDTKAGAEYRRQDGHSRMLSKTCKRRWGTSCPPINWSLLLDQRPAAAEEGEGELEKKSVDAVVEASHSIAQGSFRRFRGATGYVVVRGLRYCEPFLVPTPGLRRHADEDVLTTSGPIISPLPPLPRPTLIAVRLWVVGRGVVREGAELFSPSLTAAEERRSDYEYWLEGLLQGLESAHSLQGNGLKGLCKWRGVECGSAPEMAVLPRRLIGYVTSAGRSVVSGGSIGVAMCNVARLHHAQRQAYSLCNSKVRVLPTMLALYRNPSSSWLKPVLLEIIEN